MQQVGSVVFFLLRNVEGWSCSNNLKVVVVVLLVRNAAGRSCKFGHVVVLLLRNVKVGHVVDLL